MHNKATLLVRKDWLRPSRTLVDGFRDIPSALVADALGQGFGIPGHDIRPIWKGPAFVGPALPVQTAPEDILAVHAALKFALPGDVMVIATGRGMRAAVMGGMTVSFLRKAHVAAAVTDGVVRDVSELEVSGIPIYARGISPGIPFKKGPGRIGLAVSLGVVAVEPGDIVVGDQDGIVIVPLQHAEAILATLTNATKIEAELREIAVSDVIVPPYAENALSEDDVTYLD